MNLINAFLILATTANAFQLPSSSLPGRCYSIQPTYPSNRNSAVASSTALNGKLWKRLEIEEDPPEMGTSWYLINCVAGVELDLLNQARYVCADFPETDVEKFVVPTERHLRSHGDKKKVVDVKVRYPGYLFCKIRLVEDVYEELQNLELARSWMGTVNRKGHKKLPPSPLPLGPEEVVKFKGLEKEMEEFENRFEGDYTGRGDTGADLMEQYAGYDVGQMVKVLRGNFEGEDGTVRRLKGGQLMVRMFTYGQTYDEWFDPDAIRPLSDLEVMRGLSGPTTPINQDQFDVSIGKKDPSVLEGQPMMDDANMGGGSGALRSSLMQNSGAAPGRNRREDRVARGETGNNDMFGRSANDIKTEEENWLAYREQQRAGQRGDQQPAAMAQQEIEIKPKPFKPPKGKDTWGIVERSSWTGGEYGFEADSEEEERQRQSRTADTYKDRPVRGRRGRDDDRNSRFGGRGSDDRNDRRERRPERRSRDQDGGDDDWSSSSSKSSDDSSDMEADFFDSLMSELSDDLDDKSGSNEERTRGSHRHENAGSTTKTEERTSRSSGEEDSFFENLMSELGGALDEPSSSPSAKAKSERKVDDDDFFSNLEAELSQSLGDFGSSNSETEDSSDDDDDDFFASLQQEMGQELDEESPEKVDDTDDADDFFSSLIDEVADDLADEISAAEPPAPAPAPAAAPESSSSHQASSDSHSDLTSLTVPALKDILRSKGLKVGGKKSELIERLQSS